MDPAEDVECDEDDRRVDCREQHPDRRVREDDPLVGNPSYPLRCALHDARPPGLMLVREPHELGLERAHPQLALGARLVELAEANGHVTADDDRTPARLDDDHLHAARVARRRDEAEPGQQLELAVDRLVAHARRVDPLADRVVVLRARVLELLPLNVNRPSGERVVAAAVVKVRCVLTTTSTPARSNACSLSGTRRGSMSATSGRSSVMPVSTSTRASGWSMTWTQTGQRSPSTSNSATSSGVIVGGGGTRPSCH